MKVRIAFGKWDGSPEESATVVCAVDEYAEDSWGGTPPWYLNAVQNHKKESGEVREVFIVINDSLVESLFKAPTLAPMVSFS